MQQELTDLQPQLIKTSAETETLMGKIEVDTVEVEAKKEVCTWRLFLDQELISYRYSYCSSSSCSC